VRGRRIAGRGVVAATAAIAALAVRRLRPFRVLVEGESMAPTLRDGDQLVAVAARRIRVGDVVVVRPPARGFEMVKRVAGVPGDRVEGRTLGPDEYLVVGDNAAASTDGRTFGPVGADAIAGIVLLRYLPRPGRVR
jgi:signal peptidase I